MNTKLLYASYYLPGLVGIFRIIITLWFLFFNPYDMQLIAFQIVPAVFLVYHVFAHFRLYRDSVPVISILAPTFTQGLLAIIFQRRLNIIPFLILLVIDAGFLVLKGMKASFFPFVVEGEEEEDLDDLLEEAE